MSDGTEYRPGKGYGEADWVAVSDAPEASEAELAAARPFAEVFPDLAEGIRRARGRPKSPAPKQQVTLRLDADVVARFRAGGPGWQRRINEVLCKAIGES